MLKIENGKEAVRSAINVAWNLLEQEQKAIKDSSTLGDFGYRLSCSHGT